MNKRLIHSSVLILLAAASAFAEQPFQAQIPFLFHLGGSVLPSGAYSVYPQGGAHEVVHLRSADGKSSVMMLSHRVESLADAARAKLVFNRYGDQYFLSQVWPGNSNAGRELPKTRLEEEVAATTKRVTRTLLATK